MISCLFNLLMEDESKEIRVIRVICLALAVLGAALIALFIHANFLAVFICTCIVWDGVTKLIDSYMD